MPSLLTPAFLAGLLALVVPVLVHLRMRERRTAVPFPSLMFVRRIPHRSFRRRTLQNFLLFAARTLAVVLISFAFARPFFPLRTDSALAAAGPRGRVIALDVSASMGYEGVFPRALAEAEKAIGELKPTDAVGVLLFSDRVSGIAPPSTDHARAIAALREAKPGARSTKFAPALRLAGDWLAALRVDQRDIVLITDGQTRALAGVSDVSLPSGTTVVARSVAAPKPDNAAVAEVTVEHVRETDRSFGVVTARLMHQGAAARTVLATLEVAGRTIEQRSVSLPPSGAVNVTFARAPLPAGEAVARIILGRDGLEADDSFSLLLGAGSGIGVLLLDESPFVARALEIGDQPAFDVLRRSSLNASDLPGHSLVVLGESARNGLNSSTSKALAEFVREGGGLIATAPLAGIRGEASHLLPASWGESVNRLADRGASLGFVDLDHPALFAFKQARGSDFSRARFLQYRLLKPEGGSRAGSLKVLARFDDGREALVEATFGSGRVVAFTSQLDGIASDLPVQPLFLPLIHELAKYASAHQEIPLYHRVGTAAAFRQADAAKTGDPIEFTVSPSGLKERMVAGDSGVELEEIGLYQGIHASGAKSILAANLDLAESDLTSLDQDELAVAVRPAGRSSEPQGVATSPADSARQAWWRLALLFVIVLMAVETIMANARGQRAAS